MTFLDNLTSDFNNLFGSIGGNNINNNNTSTNPVSGLLDNFQSKVSGFANMGTYLLIGGAVVGLIIVLK